jgi:hypothetical protein
MNELFDDELDTQHFRTTLVAAGCEVITVRVIWTGMYVSVVNFPGNPLHGFKIAGALDVSPDEQHAALCRYALDKMTEDAELPALLKRMRAWQGGAKGTRGWRWRR